MKILFRADGNNFIGFGHLIRCVSLINYICSNFNLLRSNICICGNFSNPAVDILKKNKILFIHNDFIDEIGSLNELISLGYDTIFIDKQYNYSKEDISNLAVRLRVVLIHNLCEGAPYCNDFILPSAHTSEKRLEQIAWQNGTTKLHVGADFIIINEKILGLQHDSLSNKRLKMIVTTGGTDPRAVMLSLLEQMKNMRIDNIDVNFLYGVGVGYKEELLIAIKNAPSNFVAEAYEPSKLLNADMAISTFGISTYELMYLGIPVISVSHALLNAEGSFTLAKRYNAHIDLGLIDSLDKQSLEAAIIQLSNQPELRQYYSNIGKKLVDGKGVARVASIILNN